MKKTETYQKLVQQYVSIVEDETDALANMANLCAMLYHEFVNISWVGFYRNINHSLVLGPYQGQLACTRIAWGRGVCGTCAATGSVQLVTDVNQFAGHIACDVGTESEIVLPVMVDKTLYAVFDLDSHQRAYFDQEDEAGLQSLLAILIKNSCFTTP